ncbi:MAG: SPOR domain-containing protein [Pseudomonadota bacterium]|jgi:cell division septation protein DedD
MKHFLIGGAVALAAPVAALVLDGAMFSGPAQADVKTGVDAWTQGDYVKAVNDWRPLANAGDADAQFNLGQAYKLGRGVPMDVPIALEWFRKASEQGHLRAEDNYGLLLFQQNRREEALPYIRKSAERGEARSQYILGTALFNGEFVTKDWVQAYALMTRASASGLSQATASLEQMNNYIPADQRKKGLALASELEKRNAMTLAAATKALDPPMPVLRPAPKPIKSAAIPPSEPAKPVQVAAALVKPKVAPAPKPAAATPSGEWRIQLGAFGEESRATALWATLSKKVSGLAAYQPFYVKGGAVTRLQVGPLPSSAEAEKLCQAVKATGNVCIPKKG